MLGFRLDDVGEIVRMPALAHMPLAPRSLLGLANLRGAVLPIVSLRRLLDLPDAPLDEATRVIVIDRGAAVGFVVDRIDDLVTLPAGRVEDDDAGAGSIDPHLLDGVVKGAEGESTIKILNPQRLLGDDVRPARRLRSARRDPAFGSGCDIRPRRLPNRITCRW